MLIYLGRVDLSYSEKAVLELSVLGPCPRKGIGFITLGYEQRSRRIALLTVSLIPVNFGNRAVCYFHAQRMPFCCTVALPG